MLNFPDLVLMAVQVLPEQRWNSFSRFWRGGARVIDLYIIYHVQLNYSILHGANSHCCVLYLELLYLSIRKITDGISDLPWVLHNQNT